MTTKQPETTVERLPTKLFIPKGAWIFLGWIQSSKTDWLPACDIGNRGWIKTTDSWSCMKESIGLRRTYGLTMEGYRIITPEDLECIVLYDGMQETEFPEYVQKIFDR